MSNELEIIGEHGSRIVFSFENDKLVINSENNYYYEYISKENAKKLYQFLHEQLDDNGKLMNSWQ